MNNTDWQNPFSGMFHVIGLWASSGRADAERVAVGIERLLGWGLEVVVPQLPGDPLRYLAAADSVRLAHLHELLANRRVEAILAVRGGFGVTRLLDDIDWAVVRQRDLPTIGYSDFTGFLLAAWKQGCQRLVHGPMLCPDLSRKPLTPEEAAGAQAAMQSLAACLRGDERLLPSSALPLVLRPGQARGPLVPANLSLLTALLGTAHWPELDGCILVVEDVNEAAHRVDRMLTQLRSAGVLCSLAGLAFGQFTAGEDSEYLPEALADFADAVPGPVLAGLPFGHVPHTISLPVGATAIIDTAAAPSHRLQRG
ncbi:MAG TPA: LD-carboxypeptidase [Lentisphaeria bacterium]|nr:MAG: putative murein peptide carboxypeptidase [Lentisphaerae bacterium ADurb.Bin082]HPY89122.1 LD-carboxypeptidase [Lentisphaeria bacterium]HQL87330.1 LD-carboxypeptidase [Lentisphaeria bacterium]